MDAVFQKENVGAIFAGKSLAALFLIDRHRRRRPARPCAGHPRGSVLHRGVNGRDKPANAMEEL